MSNKTFLKIIYLILVSAGFSTSICAQELYMPRNITNAYKKGTRSLDGKPGKNYWQNRAKYNIDFTVTPETKIVSGTEKIAYTNHSPDTLKVVTIRFVNNLHKPEASRMSVVGPDFITTGLNITSFGIDGQTYNIDSKDWATAADVKLKTPILPGASASFAIDWNYPLSKQSGREGQLDSTTFFVAYAYPRISVYDDYYGWDKIAHTDRNEFYNDFNDYKFSVKVPKNYLVWATGDLLNPDEVLKPEYSKRLKKSYKADNVIHIATAEELKEEKVTSQNAWNSWKFSVDNISDVTFAVSNRYLWDAGSVIVDKATKRRASVQSAYDQKATDFPHAVEWAKLALAWFSTHTPGVAYPFAKTTAVQGFADMEYPMMVNDSSTPDNEFSQFVMNHELAHTYFPFYMGINETRYAHMDEGWATTLEYLIAVDQLGKAKADSNYKQFRVKRWILDPSTEEDQPVISLSTQLSGAGYGNNAYVKPSLAYLGLKDMLGDVVFAKSLHTYMERWNGKHPIPWDFFYSINDATGQNLNWYWNNWFFSNNYIDLSIEKVAIKGSDYTIFIKNIGGFAIPFDVIVTYDSGKKEIFHQTPSVWKNNQKEINVEVQGTETITSMVIDGGIFMDAEPVNNSWKK
jgi:hypothetical protein